MTRSFLAVAILFIAAPAHAEIVSRSADGFTLTYSTTAQIDPGDIPRALQALPDWWDSAHTYSGDASNLSLDLTPGGCWCERLTDNPAFDHARTVSVTDARIVFDAPFGPLRGKATQADLTVTWPGANGGRAPTWTFVVQGPGLGAMADVVDGVMRGAFARWVLYLEAGETAADPVS